MRYSPEATIPREIKHPKSDYDLFAEASGADAKKVILEIGELFDKLPNLPNDARKATEAIWHFLIQQKFEYKIDVFCLQDMLKQRKGNCLGLTLLLGAELSRRGFSPKYELITHPFDATDKQENKFFEELMRGDYFGFDNPVLAIEPDPHPLLRFTVVEHPTLVIDGKNFETTGLGEAKENPWWKPNAELIQPVSYAGLAGYVHIEHMRARLFGGEQMTNTEIVREVVAGLRKWKANRSVYSVLFDIALAAGDLQLQEIARQRFLNIGGDDSDFYYGAYEMTGDQTFLDKALEKYPAYLDPFVERNVVLQKNKQEAKFNLAVASWCAVNSELLGLPWFYNKYEEQVKRLYGRGKSEELKHVFPYPFRH